MAFADGFGNAMRKNVHLTFPKIIFSYLCTLKCNDLLWSQHLNSTCVSFHSSMTLSCRHTRASAAALLARLVLDCIHSILVPPNQDAALAFTSLASLKVSCRLNARSLFPKRHCHKLSPSDSTVHARTALTSIRWPSASEMLERSYNVLVCRANMKGPFFLLTREDIRQFPLLLAVSGATFSVLSPSDAWLQ